MRIAQALAINVESLRLILSWSEIVETTASISEIAEVIAAKKTSRKNTVPKIVVIIELPKPSKIWGRTPNISPGPAFMLSA